MEFEKKTGDNGGVASGEAAKTRKDGGVRKRKKGGASTSRSREKDAADEVFVVEDEEKPGRADSPPGLWATAAPSQMEPVVVINTSDEVSPTAQATKKPKVGEAKKGGEPASSSSWSEEDGDRLRPYFIRTGGRKNSLVGESLESVREVVRLFKANVDNTAENVWEDRDPECPQCDVASGKVSIVYNMVSRMLSMLLHREQDMESKRTGLEQKVAELEVERGVLREEKEDLVAQLEELRGRTPVRADGVEVATATEDAWRTPARVDGVDAAIPTEDARMEEPEPQVSVDPGLLKAIDDIVVGRLREMGGLGRKGSERVDGGLGAVTPSSELREDTWAQKLGRRTPGKGKGVEKRGEAVATSTPRQVGKGKASGPPGRAGKKKGEKGTTNRRWPVPPKTAAVTVTIPSGSATTYAEVMAAARREIPLEDLGIPHVEMRRARTGGLILGVAGEGAVEKADRLAARLSGLVAAAGARIARPTRRLDLRVTGLDMSMTAGEVAAAVSEAGGCRGEDVRCGRLGGSSPSGRTALWV